MHNIHLIRVYANNGNEACDIVENNIGDWGNENNWRTICGSIDQKGNKVDLTNNDENGWVEGRWKPDLQSAKDIMNEVYTRPPDFSKISMKNLIKYAKIDEDGIVTINNDTNSKTLLSWWNIKEYAIWAAAREWSDANGKFDIWKHTFREWELDQVGLTELDDSDISMDDVKEKMKPYIVFLDMHS